MHDNYILKAQSLIENLGGLIPITVVSAVILFCLKEIIEGCRRRAANKRKRKAIHRLLSDEIERNYWTIKKIRSHAEELNKYSESTDTKLTVIKNSLGERFLRLEEIDASYSQSPIGKVSEDVLNANIMLIAEIDEKIFEAALKFGDAVKEMDHVLSLIIEHSATPDDRGFMKGLAEYATDEANQAEIAMTELYKMTTGEILAKHRLR